MKKPTFKVYRTVLGGWRWRLLAKNHRVIAESGEAYTRKRDVMRAIDAVLLAIFDASIRDA